MMVLGSSLISEQRSEAYLAGQSASTLLVCYLRL